MLVNSLQNMSIPDGYICMAVAENRHAFPALRAQLASAAGAANTVDNSTGAYTNMKGRDAFRRTLAKLYEATVTSDVPINPDHLVRL